MSRPHQPAELEVARTNEERELAMTREPTLYDQPTHSSPGADRREKKLGDDEESLSASQRPIDYDKMEQQQIGVTRIETLWRHFGKNKPVLIALACTIFCT